VALKKADKGDFAGRRQEEILALIVDSAVQGTKQAVEDNDRLGLSSYGSINGQLVVRKPGASVTTFFTNDGSITR
jgi:hypothetical protein